MLWFILRPIIVKSAWKRQFRFRASLDDMAQIIGNAVYIADGRKADRAAGKSLKKALKHSNGCMVFRGANSKGKGVGYNITVGRSLKEAATALTVMEKAAAAEWKAVETWRKCSTGKKMM